VRIKKAIFHNFYDFQMMEKEILQLSSLMQLNPMKILTKSNFSKHILAKIEILKAALAHFYETVFYGCSV